MTDENNTEEEPSIEEILSSIRDIISDEDEDGETAPTEQPAVDDTPEVVEAPAAPVTVSVEEPSPMAEDNISDEDDDDILDLSDFEQETDDTEEEQAADDSDDPLAGINLDHPDDELDVFDVISAEETSTDDDVADILKEEPIAEMTADEEFAPAAEEIEPVNVPEDIVMDEPAVEESTDDALIDSVAEVATVGAMAKLAENLAISNSASGTTLEDIVRELLRPMLKEWLDENLPTTIERLVSKELERLAEKAMRK